MPACKTCGAGFPEAFRTVKGEPVLLLNCGLCRAKTTAKVTKYNGTAKGKLNMHKSNTSSKGKQRFKRYDQTEKGQMRIKRGKESEASILSKQRRLTKQREDPAKRLEQSLRDALGRILHGRVVNAPILWSNTEFNNMSDVLMHFSSCNPRNIDVLKLQVDHKIPTSAYDHSNPEDVRRCHSRNNIALLNPKENNEKHSKIVASVCESVGTAYWPTSWGGVLPNNAI